MEDIRHNLVTYSRCNICGVHFTANQCINGDCNKRCGSLITAVINGQSIYGKVVTFFVNTLRCPKNNAPGYAYVEWLNMPDYPMAGTPIVVRLSDNSPSCTESRVISIFDIDPSRIISERSDSERSYYMCRIEGTDTIKT